MIGAGCPIATSEAEVARYRHTTPKIPTTDGRLSIINDMLHWTANSGRRVACGTLPPRIPFPDRSRSPWIECTATTRCGPCPAGFALPPSVTGSRWSRFSCSSLTIPRSRYGGPSDRYERGESPRGRALCRWRRKGPGTPRHSVSIQPRRSGFPSHHARGFDEPRSPGQRISTARSPLFPIARVG